MKSPTLDASECSTMFAFKQALVEKSRMIYLFTADSRNGLWQASLHQRYQRSNQNRGFKYSRRMEVNNLRPAWYLSYNHEGCY